VFEYPEYPKDIWDYLAYEDDLPYMPSRQDRDALLDENVEKHRVQIWDYFFRIKPEDVGLPQQREIQSIRKSLQEFIDVYTQDIRELKNKINELNRIIFFAKLKRALLGFGFLAFGLVIFFRYLVNVNSIYFYCISFPLLLFGVIAFLSIRFTARDERRAKSGFEDRLIEKKQQKDARVNRDVKRIRVLDEAIDTLKLQLPEPPYDYVVREWLTQDFRELWKKAIEKTGLGSDRLVEIRAIDSQGNPVKADNPIGVLGPGELQHPERIPLSFTKNINPDLNKHLTARRAFHVPEYQDKWEVLYGIYYAEYILIADDMMATYGLFFDFITKSISSEQITEQYYKDVVAISISNEFRTLNLGVDSQDVIYIEDAPTLTLSLASSEHRTVTFVNENYFMKIKEKINISEDNVSKIYWIQDSQKIADNAIKALRAHLRKHKGTDQGLLT
jgi:hypothetical protein